MMTSMFVCVSGLFAIEIKSAISIPVNMDGFSGCLPFSNGEWASFLRVYLPWTRFIVGNAIPFVFIISCNVAIVVKLVKSSRTRSEVSNISDTNNSNLIGLTLMLLLNSTAFLLLKLPSDVVFWYKGVMTPQGQDLFRVTANILVMNYAINFFLYCLAGKKFRQELIGLFCFQCAK